LSAVASRSKPVMPASTSRSSVARNPVRRYPITSRQVGGATKWKSAVGAERKFGSQVTGFRCVVQTGRSQLEASKNLAVLAGL